MARIEQVNPKLVRGRFEESGLDLIFQPESGGGFREPALFKKDDEEFLRTLNGSLALSEAWNFLYKKGERVRFDRSMQTLKKLANLKYFENWETVLELLKRVETDTPQGEKPLLPTSSHNQPHFDKNYFSKERIFALLKKTVLFHHCTQKDVEMLYKYSDLVEFERGTLLVEKGKVEKTIFVVLSGDLGVFENVRKNKKSVLAYLDQYKVFGESSAVLNKPRTADVVGLSKGWVLEINIHKVIDIKKTAAFDSFKSLKTRVLVNQILAMNPLFNQIPSDVLQLFLKSCTVEKHKGGETIIKQGEQSDSFYFVLDGLVEVIQDEKSVAKLGRGNYFGELGVLDKKPRNASIYTLSPSVLLKLQANDFFSVLANNLCLGLLIEKEADNRRGPDDFAKEEWTQSGMDISSLESTSNSSLSLDNDFDATKPAPQESEHEEDAIKPRKTTQSSEQTFTKSDVDFSSPSGEANHTSEATYSGTVESLEEDAFSPQSSYDFDEDLGPGKDKNRTFELDQSALDLSTSTDFEIESLDFSEFNN